MVKLDIDKIKKSVTNEEKNEAMLPVYKKAEKIIQAMILAHVILSFIFVFYFETWSITLGVVIPAVLLYFLVHKTFPHSYFARANSGIVVQTFMMLHIYQMHGLAEMHFFFFTSTAIMIIYMDWVAIVPMAVYVSVQHLSFILLHNYGWQIYFFEDPYISWTKAIFHYFIAVFQVVISCFWAYTFRERVLENYYQNKALAKYSEEQLEGKDKILKNMIQDLGNVSNSVKESYLDIVRSAEEISNSLEFVAKGTGLQNQLADNTLLEAQKLGDKINSLLGTAQLLISKTKEMKSENTSGVELIQNLQSNFQKNQEATKKVNSAITDLTNRSKDVSSIISKIKSIADQTHLLSLNASIEAARAGEYGKGFAVVASEVGKLADESSRSTKEISAIVHLINNSILTAKDEMNKAQTLVQNSELDMQRTVKTFNEIEKTVFDVADKNTDLKEEIQFMNILKENTISNSQSILNLIQDSASSIEEISATTNEQSNTVQNILSKIHELDEKVQRISLEIKNSSNENL